MAAAALVAPLGMTQASAQVDDDAGESSAYIVQLVDLPIAAYDGELKGLKATEPGVGERVDVSTDAARDYADYLSDQQQEAVEAAGANSSDVLHSYDTALNGVALELTAGEAAALRKNAGVLNVWETEMLTADTITTPDYLGLTGSGGVWSEQFGGPENAGDGMVVGVIDSGIWPENPSFAELPGADVPDDWAGECVEGEDPDDANNVTCNNKLIGARYYNEDVEVVDVEFESPRDYDGHGTHTAGTAAGNNGVPMTVNEIELGDGSGMAPVAHVAAYKALWADGEGQASGSSADLVKAIDDAVFDGVDVINYSVSGSRQFVVDPVELAFLNAAIAGVFVSTSAGNSGATVGSSSVAHNSPWTMTVAASTHNRNVNKTVTLGNGDEYEGVGVGPGVEQTDLVYAGEIPASGATDVQAQQCRLDIDGGSEGNQIAIDAAEAAGKIVICDRGGVDRVDKSAAVAEAGGVGMIHANTDPAQSLNADFHSVPTVHVNSTIGDVIKDYAETASYTPTAAIGEPQDGAVVAPEVAGFSSYGPAQAGSGDLLKPDITAPGVDIIAAVAPPGWGGENFESLSGTSMSAPHIAGLAALMMQANPQWSPAAVKSAMMTTARTTNSDGGQIQRTGDDATALDYGSGEVVPGSAYEPGLVYEAGNSDWLTYACSINQLQLVTPPGFCDGIDADPSDLNYPTIAIGELAGQQTVTRTVRNVGDSDATYTSGTSVAPPGITMTVTPASLTVPAGEEASFEVAFSQVNAPLDTYTFGSVVWEGSDSTVTSQVAIQPTAVATLDEIIDTGADGSRDYDLVSGFTGTLNTDIDGLVAAEVVDAATIRDPDSLIDGTATFDVPAGTKVLRFATFDEEVPAADVDLNILDPDGRLAGSSATGTSAEEFTLSNPDPGEWTVAVDLFSDEPSATVPVNGFFVDEEDADNLSVSPTSSTVVPADEVAMTAQWSGLDANTRYLGAINYSNGSDPVGRTLVNITVDSDGGEEVGRVGGANRYETAALIAGQYPDDEPIETVYITNGRAFADALSASSPAANANVPTTMEKFGGVPAPVLLTRQDSLPDATTDALDAIDPSQIVVLGGPAAVSDDVATELEAYGEVERIGGANRYETSALLAELSGEDVDVVYLASGADDNFPDALSGGALAGSQNAPVLLTRPDRVDEATEAALDDLNPDEIVVLGGSRAVSDAVYDEVGANRRLAGDTRYDTSVEVSKEFDADIDGTYVASGQEWPDALAGSALSGFLGQPITLSETDDVPDVVMDELDRLSPDEVTMLGGEAALTDNVETELNGSYGSWRE